MLYFFIGFLFDFAVTLIGGKAGLFPTPIGALLILYGAYRLRETSKHFASLFSAAIALAVASALQIALSLLGVLASPFLALGVSLAATFVYLLVAKLIAEGTKHLEARYNRFIGASKLMTAWGFLSLGSLLIYLPLFVPSLFLPLTLLQILSYFWFGFSLYSIYAKTK